MVVYLIPLGLAPIVLSLPVQLTNSTITQHSKLQALVLWLTVYFVPLDSEILCALPHFKGRVELPVQLQLLGATTYPTLMLLPIVLLTPA
jgi:hypothetical protein